MKAKPKRDTPNESLAKLRKNFRPASSTNFEVGESFSFGKKDSESFSFGQSRD